MCPTILSTAAIEILRIRLDDKTDSDVHRQIRMLKYELDKAKVAANEAKEETKEAREEANRLRTELEEEKGRKGRTRSRGRRSIIRDSPSPTLPPKSPSSKKKDYMEKEVTRMVINLIIGDQTSQADTIEMDMEVDAHIRQ